jgi:hypothetical protein
MALDERDPAEAFVALEPPAGGLPALRARLQREHERDQRSRRIRWPLTALTTAVAAMAVLGLGLRGGPRAPRLIDGAPAEHYPNLAALGLAALPAEPVTILGEPAGGLQLRRVPVKTASVVFYLVRSGRAPSGAAAP